MQQAVPPPIAAEDVPLGAALIVAAFLLVAIMSALGKGAAVSTSAIVFFQNFISLLLFLPWVLHQGVTELKTKHLLLHTVRGLGGVLSQALMFIAILKMPLMNTVLLSNSAPLFIPLIAWLWLREKITISTAISLAIGFIGVLFILKPGPSLLRNPAALVATAAAICSAIALVTVNRLSNTEPTDRILFYYFLTASLLTAPFLPFGWHSPDARQWFFLFGIGVCQAASQLLIILAYRYAKPGRIAPFNYSVVILAGLIGWIVWHNRPDALALVGVVLVSAGGILTTLKAGPNTHGHFGWIGYWNADRRHLKKLGEKMAASTISGDDVQCVLKWDAIVGESPLWNSVERRLYWVDIQGKKVHRFDPEHGRNETFTLPDLVTCLAFRRKGGLLLTLRKNFAFFDPDFGNLEKLATVEADKSDNRFNDGRVDPQGRFWAGTMGDPAWDQPVGSLYRFDPDLTVTRMQTHVACSNGTAWSPNGRTMYYTESFRYAIFAYDFDSATGSLANRRVFAEVDRKLGAIPDGLCVDAEGHVWSNQVGIGRVVRYDPAGRIERQIQLPVPRAVGSTFGGDDLDTLFITSARETMTSQQLQSAPLSGSIFAVKPGVRGQPVTSFEG